MTAVPGLTKRIERIIREWIEDGMYGPGEMLSSERMIMDHFRASRTTVRLALMKLVAEGTIIARQGKGYFVTLSASPVAPAPAPGDAPTADAPGSPAPPA